MRADIADERGVIPDRAATAVRRTIRVTLDAAGAEDDWRLEVAFVRPETIRALNRRYRGRDKATNVLSFPGTGRPPTPRSRLRDLGEILIAPAVAAEEVQRHGIAAEVRLAHLIVHGVLHLVGYDHVDSDADRARMEAVETRALDALEVRTYRALAALVSSPAPSLT